MQSFLERALPAIAAWGVVWFAVLFALTLFGIWRLGRGRRLLVPAGWRARTGSAVLLVLLALSGVALYGLLVPLRPMLDQVRSVSRVVGRPAANIAFRQVADDRPRRLSELRDQVVLLNLWATWCPPCRHELPAIDRLQRTYQARGLVVVTLSNEDRLRLLDFVARHPLSTLNVYTRELGWLDVDGRPVTVLIDRQGRVRELIVGARTYEEFESTVTKYLDRRS